MTTSTSSVTSATSSTRSSGAGRDEHQAQRRRLGGGVHAAEHVGQAQHADAAEQAQQAAGDDQHPGDDVEHVHAPLRSMKRATIAVPRKPTTATTNMTSR